MAGLLACCPTPQLPQDPTFPRKDENKNPLGHGRPQGVARVLAAAGAGTANAKGWAVVPLCATATSVTRPSSCLRPFPGPRPRRPLNLPRWRPRRRRSGARPPRRSASTEAAWSSVVVAFSAEADAALEGTKGEGTVRKMRAYLASKGGDVDFLRFEGKNKVVFRKTGAPPRPDVVIAQPCDPDHLPPGVRVDRVWHPEM